MAIKKYLISGQPKYTDISQYNFDDAEQNITYINSNSLPQNSDKFQNKDLQTTSYGHALNEQIIARNLFFSGSSFIKIDKLRIDNTGVNYKTKNIKVEVYLFSQQSFVNDDRNDSNTLPQDASYGKFTSILNPSGVSDNPYQIYSETFSNKKAKKGLGNIENLEGVEIVTNINDRANLAIGDLPGSTFEDTSLSTADEDTVGLIDSTTLNPLYIAVWMRGNAKRWWGTDRRKRRLQVFQINNMELYDSEGSGRVNEISFDNASYSTTGGGGKGGAEAAAFKVSSLRLVVNTRAGEGGVEITSGDEAVIENVLSSVEFISPVNYYISNNLYMGKFSTNFLQTSPNRQLINDDDYGVSQTDIFPDYFPLTHIRVVETLGGLNNDVIQNDDDLQTYHNDIQSINASVPVNIGFSLQMVSPTDFSTGYPQQDLTNPTDDNPAGNYFYFVIDWNDIDDKFTTIDDYLDSKPETLEELEEKQSNNLYNFRLQNGDGIDDLNGPILNNLYTTPGIKTIKIIVFSYDETNNQTGRWKLVKSRFYLNEPLYKYPDFGEVGGSDYTTIPWPYTTPIIGGVDGNSKYKKSVQNTLSSGKIGDSDIIDEKFLINDLENDEMGKTIIKFDLEQIRYFNKDYNMNTLLGVNSINYDGFRPYNYIIESPNEIEDVLFENITHNNYYGTSNQWFGELESSGNRTGTDLYEQQKYNDDSRGIHIKYTADAISGNTWTFFKYQRKDLNNSLKTYEEGGTEYTFEVDIRFNEFSSNAPISYVFRTANRANDYGYSYRQGDFSNGNLHFYRGDEGVYSDSSLQNKLGDYGDWITIKETRKLISNYSSSVEDGYVDGFPNMEFLTNNWYNNSWDEGSSGDAVLDFDIRNPIMLPTEIYEETDYNLLNQDRIYWDGEINKFSEETSVGQIFIDDNLDLDLKQSCKLELNTGELTGKSILDTSGNSNKGLLIGDYKVKKVKKGQSMRRDSFIKVPKKTNNKNGAL